MLSLGCFVVYLGLLASVPAARADDSGMMAFLLSEGERARSSHKPLVNPFAQLFGAGHATAAATPPRRVRTARAARIARRHVSRIRRPAKTVLAKAREIQAPIADVQAPVDAEPPILVGRAAAYLTDETLQPGDVVVTAAGVRVFNGDNAAPHSNRDFLPLSRARRASNHATLEAIDRSIRRERLAVAEAEAPNTVLAAGVPRPSAVPTDERPQRNPATQALAYAPAAAAPEGPAVRAIERAIRNAPGASLRRSFTPTHRRARTAWRLRHHPGWRTQRYPRLAHGAVPIEFESYVRRVSW